MVTDEFNESVFIQVHNPPSQNYKGQLVEWSSAQFKYGGNIPYTLPLAPYDLAKAVDVQEAFNL